jgi:hypothetical protein
MKKLALLLGIFTFLLVPNVQSVTLTVCGSGCNSTTIQGAIDLANSGDTIEVDAGTYNEQVVINKSLTVQGVGDTTIIKPSSAVILTQIFTGLFWYGGTKNVAGIIVANVPDGSNVTIRNLKIDESNITIKPSGSDYLAGTFYRETGGTIDNVSIIGGGAWSGTDRAYGVFLSATTNTVIVEVKGLTITNFDKNGIEVMGSQLTANIHDNIITGRGSISDEVQNGINVGRDATGIVNYNTISNLAYQPASSLSAGILFYHYVSPTGRNATTIGNNITNCQIGIIFKNANATAWDNNVYGGTVGLDGIFTQPNYAGAYVASFVNNTISGITNRSAIDAETYSTLTPPNGATLSVIIADNTLTVGYGTADGIYIGGGAGSIVAAISGNIISDFGEYGINLGDVQVSATTITGNTITNNQRGVSVGIVVNSTKVEVNLNDISGNQNYDIYNGGLGILNATFNWWGSAVPNSSKFYGNVTYYPFCLNAICTLNIEGELSEFTGGNTTNFSSISNWSDVDLVLDADNSKINWTVPIDLNNSSLRFNNYVSFSHNRISVDTSQMPELNHSAILTFKSTGFTGISQFTVLRNGILCPTSICTSYHLDIGGNVELVVTQMSEYSLSESHLINNLGVFAFPALIVLGAGVLLFLFEGLFSGSTDIKKLVEVIIGTLIVLALILSLI